MSPSCKRRCPGMPCTTSSLTEMQQTAGKGTLPGTPLKSGVARCSIKYCSTAESISRVVTPGRTRAAASRWAFQTTRPAWRIKASSRGDLSERMRSSLPSRGQAAPSIDNGLDAAKYFVGRAQPVDCRQQAQPAVVLHQRPRLIAIDRQAFLDHGG